MQTADHLPHAVKTGVDALSAGVVVATIFQWLPAVAALFTIVWTGIRIFETRTVQSLVKRFRKN